MSQRPYLLPWVRVLLLIRDIRSTTWGHERWPHSEAAPPPRAGDAPADRAGRLVELTPATRRRRAALGFVQLPAAEPALQLLHHWLDTWTGVGLIIVGVERLGPSPRLTHLEENEWCVSFESNARFAPNGFRVAAAPRGAVQRAAWAVVARTREQAGLRRRLTGPHESV
jgi:hypothetical protein